MELRVILKCRSTPRGSSLPTCVTLLSSSASTGPVLRYVPPSMAGRGLRVANRVVEFPDRTDRGQYKVYNMTLQGGHPLTQAARCPT